MAGSNPSSLPLGQQARIFGTPLLEPGVLNFNRLTAFSPRSNTPQDSEDTMAPRAKPTGAKRGRKPKNNGVVQEYEALPPPPPEFDDVNLSSLDKIRKAAEYNGIVRPAGYTVSWHHNHLTEKHHFGADHPMKPHRLTLTKQLIFGYGMNYAMDSYRTRPASDEEMAKFHAEDYLEFLKDVTPDTYEELANERGNYGFNADCPVFDGLYEYCALYGGGSIDAARKIANKQSDIAINWSGGLHHAHKTSAAGFCYVNDIVLAILELLRFHARVLYIDIDVHHGDGVEEAFWSTDRVMTVSFHKYHPGGENTAGILEDRFFPGTGRLDDTGPEEKSNRGRRHTVNIPLMDGIEDDQYISLFKSVMTPVMKIYQPNAVVLQCGADSLGGDLLGRFSLSIKAHGACTSFIKSYNLPLIILGGGGYTPRNVARAWTYETSLMVGANLSPRLPNFVPYIKSFDKEGRTLFPVVKPMFNNLNTREYTDELVRVVTENLRYLQGAPSVQMKVIPPGLMSCMDEGDEEMEEAREDEEDWRKERERGTGIRGEYDVD